MFWLLRTVGVGCGIAMFALATFYGLDRFELADAFQSLNIERAIFTLLLIGAFRGFFFFWRSEKILMMVAFASFAYCLMLGGWGLLTNSDILYAENRSIVGVVVAGLLLSGINWIALEVLIAQQRRTKQTLVEPPRTRPKVRTRERHYA